MAKGGQSVRQTQSGTQSNFHNSTSNNSQMLDPSSQAYVDWQRGVAQQGVNAAQGAPNLADMYRVLGGMGSGGGGGGFGGGVPNVGMFTDSVKQFMNPYIQNVVDATKGEFGAMRDQATTDANAMATRAGAFGGSRAAAYLGARQGELDRAQGSQIAGLLSGGYDKASDNAFNMINAQSNAASAGGAGAAAANANDLARAQFMFNAYDRINQISDPLNRYSGMLGLANAGMGPTGWNQNTSTSGNERGGFTNNMSQQMPSNTFGNLLGAGLSIGSMFLPGGGLVRAAAGALPQVSPGMAGGGNGFTGGYMLPPGGIFR